MRVPRILAIVMLLTLPALGATIQLADGKSVEGEIRFDDGKVILRRGGKDEKIPLEQIQRMVVAKEERAPGTTAEVKAEKLKLEPARGLKGEYFAGREFKELKLTRIDPRIEFSWAEKVTPDPAVPALFSVRWTGFVQPEHTEKVTFFLDINEGARLWVDDTLLFDRWDGPPGNPSGEIALTKGKKVKIKIEYHNSKWWGSAHLHWQSAKIGRQVVPTERLTPGEGVNVPAVKVIAPRTLQSVSAARPVALEAIADDEAHSVKRVEFFVDGAAVGSSEKAPWKAEWKNPVAGAHRIVAKATNAQNISAASPEVEVILGGNGEGLLPPGWAEAPIGTRTPVATRLGFADGRFTMEAMRGSFYNEKEEFHLVYQPMIGDGAISARIEKFESVANGQATAGIVIRESLSKGNIREGLLGLTTDTGLVFLRRENPWEQPLKSTEDRDTVAPCWLKLARFGNNLRAYRSEDGEKWKMLWERRVEMGRDSFVGLALAGGGLKPASAVFSGVKVVLGSPEQASSIRGLMLTSGTLIAGDIRAADDTSIKIARGDREIIIPTSQVSRLLFRPLTREAVTAIGEARSGVMLASGDFFDGTVAGIKDGDLRLSSVLFGMKKFNLWDQQMMAVLIRGAEARPYKWVVKSKDKTVCLARSVRIEKDRLIATDPSDVELEFGAWEIEELVEGK